MRDGHRPNVARTQVVGGCDLHDKGTRACLRRPVVLDVQGSLDRQAQLAVEADEGTARESESYKRALWTACCCELAEQDAQNEHVHLPSRMRSGAVIPKSRKCAASLESPAVQRSMRLLYCEACCTQPQHQMRHMRQDVHPTQRRPCQSHLCSLDVVLLQAALMQHVKE